MFYTTSEYTNHTGLGSKLFAWGRAKVLQQAFDVKMLQQQWISIRGAGVTRGGIDYSKILGKIYLFNNFKNDVGEISWLEWQLNLKRKFPTVFVNNLSEALEVLAGYNKLIVFRWHGGHYFTDLEKLWACFKILFGVSDVPLYNFDVVVALWSNVFWLMLACALCLPLAARFDRWCSINLRPLQLQSFVIGQNLLLLAVCVVLLVGQTYNPFIYFRF